MKQNLTELKRRLDKPNEITFGNFNNPSQQLIE